MPCIRLEGPDYTLLHTKMPEQALAASNREFTMPGHMPEQLVERCLLVLVVTHIDTEIVARWQQVGDNGLSTGHRPDTPASHDRIVFHARVNETGRYCVYSTIPRNYNCHWLLWMTHPDCTNYSWRAVYGLENRVYAQRASE